MNLKANHPIWQAAFSTAYVRMHLDHMKEGHSPPLPESDDFDRITEEAGSIADCAYYAYVQNSMTKPVESEVEEN